MKHNSLTHEHSTLRKQLEDTLRYLRKYDGYCIPREDVEVHMEHITTEHTDVSLSTLVNAIAPSDYSTVFVRGGAGEDYDGYPEGWVQVYTYRKQTDEEYFDSVRRYLLPTEYQQKQYQEYLRLKNIFEKDGV